MRYIPVFSNLCLVFKVFIARFCGSVGIFCFQRRLSWSVTVIKDESMIKMLKKSLSTKQLWKCEKSKCRTAMEDSFVDDRVVLQFSTWWRLLTTGNGRRGGRPSFRLSSPSSPSLALSSQSWISSFTVHIKFIFHHQEWLEEEGEENISSIMNRNGTFNATSPALVCFISLFAWNISVIFNFRLHSVSQNSDTIKFRYQRFQLILPTPALSSSGWKLKCFESHFFLTF